MRIVLPMATIVVLLATTRVATAQLSQPSNLLVSDQAESVEAGYPRVVENAVPAAWGEELPPETDAVEIHVGMPYVEDDAPLCGDLLCGDGVGMEGLMASHAGGQWSILTELTTLFPSYSTATLATANEHPIFGPRVSMGWESDRGFGIRGRGWGFDGDSKIEQSPTPSTQGLLPYYDYYYGYYYSNSPAQVVSHQINFSGSRFDLDFYKRVKHGTGDFVFGASVTAAHLTLREQYAAVSRFRPFGPPFYPDGIADDIDGDGRYGSHGFDLESPARIADQVYAGQYVPYISSPPNLENVASTHTAYVNGVYTTTYQGGQLVRNRGAGLGLLAEGTHRFYETPHHIWSIFGRGRIAYLIGRWDEPYSNTLTEGDGNMAIGEAAFGLEYRRPFRYADLSVQCAFEVQSWDVSIVERINLAGVTTGVGLSW